MGHSQIAIAISVLLCSVAIDRAAAETVSLRDPEPLIIELPEPPRDAGHKESHADLSRLLDRLSRRIVRVLEQRGLLIADPVDPYLEYEPG